MRIARCNRGTRPGCGQCTRTSPRAASLPLLPSRPPGQPTPGPGAFLPGCIPSALPTSSLGFKGFRISRPQNRTVTKPFTHSMDPANILFLWAHPTGRMGGRADTRRGALQIKSNLWTWTTWGCGHLRTSRPPIPPHQPQGCPCPMRIQSTRGTNEAVASMRPVLPPSPFSLSCQLCRRLLKPPTPVPPSPRPRRLPTGL
jgi:hypothetical protein